MSDKDDEAYRLHGQPFGLTKEDWIKSIKKGKAINLVQQEKKLKEHEHPYWNKK